MTAIQGVTVGASAPDLELDGSTGRIRLSQYRDISSVVLFFMRDFGCHTCVGHVLALFKDYASIKAAGAEVLIFGGGPVASAKRLAEKYKLPFPVLADTEHSAFDRFGLDKVLLYWQKSGSFVIDCEGTIVYANASTGPGGSLEMEEIKKALSERA